jgi:hypothetical protein
MSIGNVYWVIPTNKAYYQDFVLSHQVRYSDGSLSVYPDPLDGSGILAAIKACKGSRNDFIYVLPGTYTMSLPISFAGKSGVRFQGVNGPMSCGGATTSVYLLQTGAYANIISSANTEITGFAIKNAVGYSAITIPASIFSNNIHHNWFMMVEGGSYNIIDATASGANKMGRIAFNRFYSEVSGNLNAAIACCAGYAQDVIGNHISFANAGTRNYGIFNDSTGGITADNYISESGEINTCVVSQAIHVNVAGCAINNRCAVKTGQGVDGGTAGESFVDNRDALAGGAVVIET